MTLTLGIGIALGLVSLLIGLLCYPHANTRVARRQASTGAILGVQGVLVGTFGIVFVHGDMTTFTRVFLNFPQVVSWFPFFVTGFYNTIILTLVSTAVGIGLGLVISMFLLSSRRILRVPARAYVNVLRGTPMLIELAIVYFGLALGLRLSLSPFVAMIVALSLNASSYMAETFRGGLQSIARGQLEAARSLGLTHWQALQHVAIPQAFRRVIPPVMNNFIFIAKETSLLAFLGVALGNRDLYSVASQGYSQFFNSTFFIAAAAGYLLVTLPLIGLVNLAEKKVHSGLVGIGSEG
jgi:His/Glu/Gln/Arg/opine family amino acid ABC transporter permease subunit